MPTAHRITDATAPGDTTDGNPFGFAVVERGHRARRDTPQMSLRSGSTLGLNQAAFTELGGAGNVEIVYSARLGVLGLRTVANPTTHSRRLRPYTSNNTTQVNLGPFGNTPGIANAARKPYPARWYGDVLGIALEDAEQEG